MSKKKLSRGIRKYICREKARIRKEISDFEEQEREIEDLCRKVRRGKQEN